LLKEVPERGVKVMGPIQPRTAMALALTASLAASQLTAAEPAGEKSGPAVVRTARSGVWSAPATWEGGKVPSGNVRVLIREGHRVVYDLQATKPIRSLTISGILSFAHDKDTRLDVGLIKIQPGEDCTEEGFACDAHAGPPDGKPRAALEVGTPETPIPADRTA